jgi:branched-chain amino acid transport system permease protein
VKFRQYVRDHLEIVGLAVLFLATFFLPGKSVPFGIDALGVVGGSAIALQALGIVLVYRANRVINFAQVEIGAIGGVLFLHSVRRGIVLLGVHYVCPSCVRVAHLDINGKRVLAPVGVSHNLALFNYWATMVLSILLVLLLSYVVHALVIRRFTNAPRLTFTLLTIGLAQSYVLVQALIRRVFDDGVLLPAQPFPFKVSMKVGSVQFGTTDIMTVIIAVACMAGLALFLTRIHLGIVLRGAADNPARAQSLGVNVPSVSATAWVIAAGLSVMGAMLAATSNGVTGGATSSTLVRILAAAVIGGMMSFPITIVAALVIGVVDQSILYALSSPPLVDAVLVAVIVGVLLLQRNRATRTDDAALGWKSTKEVRPIPAELRNVDVVKRWLRNGQIAAVVIGLGLPWVLSPGQTTTASTSFIYGMVALSLLILTGWAGQISLGQFGIAAVGAWVVAASGWPLPFALPAGALAGAGAAVIVGLPALRLRGLHLAISTLAFAVGASAIFINGRYLGKYLPSTMKRPVVLGFDFNDARVFYYFVLAMLIATVLATIGMRRSRTARVLIACRENEALAQTYGVNLMRVRLASFAISGFIAALAGGLIAYAQFGVHSEQFDASASIYMFLVAIVGGMSSIAGPLLSALFYFVINTFGSNVLVALAATGVGVVLLVVFMPGGLSELFFGLRDTWLRRVAERYHIDVPSLIEDRARRGERARIAPKQTGSGAQIHVPVRYRLDDQWTLEQAALEAAAHD